MERSEVHPSGEHRLFPKRPQAARDPPSDNGRSPVCSRSARAVSISMICWFTNGRCATSRHSSARVFGGMRVPPGVRSVVSGSGAPARVGLKPRMRDGRGGLHDWPISITAINGESCPRTLLMSFSLAIGAFHRSVAAMMMPLSAYKARSAPALELETGLHQARGEYGSRSQTRSDGETLDQLNLFWSERAGSNLGVRSDPAVRSILCRYVQELGLMEPNRDFPGYPRDAHGRTFCE